MTALAWVAAMKVLTLHRPWAGFVARGIKPIENRSWTPPLDLLGQRFIIHAGQTWDTKAVIWHVQTFGGHPDPREHPEGIIGSVRLRGWCDPTGRVVRWHPFPGDPSPIHVDRRHRVALFGPWGWIVDAHHAYPKAIVAGGHQKLWNLPARLVDQVRELEDPPCRCQRDPDAGTSGTCSSLNCINYRPGTDFLGP